MDHYECCSGNNSGRCDVCNRVEDVEHYIMNCRKYNVQRQNLFEIASPTLQQNGFDLNLKNVLFPPIRLNWQHRKLILDSLIEYVLKTKRFKCTKTFLL